MHAWPAIVMSGCQFTYGDYIPGHELFIPIKEMVRICYVIIASS